MYPVLEVTDRDGWRKEFPLERTLVMVGSNPANHIALPDSRGQGVEPRHLQLMLSPHDQSTCRVVNMSKSGVEVNDGGQTTTLGPAKMLSISMDSALKVGDYRLQLRGVSAAPYSAPPNGNGRRESAPAYGSAFAAPVTTMTVLEKPMALPRTGAPPVFGPGPVGLSVRLTQPTLTRSQPAEAVITVANRGERTAVQIRLQVDGLPADCFEVPPLPLLFPGAEKTVVIPFSHPDTVLKAGPHALRFLAVAPESYPGEQAVVQQTVTVPPFYAHEVTLRGPV